MPVPLLHRAWYSAEINYLKTYWNILSQLIAFSITIYSMAINYLKEVTFLPILLKTLIASQYSEPVKHFSRFRIWICLWRWMSKNCTWWTVAFKNRHKLHAGPPTQTNHNIFTARFSRPLCPSPWPRCMFKETRKQNIFSYKPAPYLTPFSRSVSMSSQ